MPILKDEIQILRVHELSNSSQIVVALGRRLGQFRVMAKGSRRWPRKGFEGGFDLLLRGELLAYPRPGEQLWIFKEWDERARPGVGQSYRQLAAGSYLCELTEALTRHTSGSGAELAEHESIDALGTRHSALGTSSLYDLLEVSADALAAQVVEPGILLLNFTLNALAGEGVLPDLERCMNCGARIFGAQKHTGVNAPRSWMRYDGIECLTCFHQVGSPQLERGFYLDPEAHRALLHLRSTLKPLKLTPAARVQLARAMAVLVHGAIERDLSTLPYAMTLLRMTGVVPPLTNSRE